MQSISAQLWVKISEHDDKGLTVLSYHRRLAKSRSNPHLLDIGFEKEEIKNGDWDPMLDIKQSEEDLFKSKSYEDLNKFDI